MRFSALQAAASLVSALTLFPFQTNAILNLAGSANIAVYWGQNSLGTATSQGSLASYCANTNVDVIPIAFVTSFYGLGGYPVMNFASAGAFCGIFPGTNLWNCPNIAADITTCQVTFGKKILLSLGGSTYNEGGFTTATFFNKANQLWTMFGRPAPGQSTAVSKDRPFGAAMVDGFDFDFESTTTNLVPFAQQLRANMNADTVRTGRQWLLSVSPQCPFPDATMGSLLNSPLVKTDLVFVQFYNNPSCGLNAFSPTTAQTFNFATWDKWAKSTSVNKAVKVFLGVPGGPNAAAPGYYKTASGLGPIIAFCKTFTSFGGVAMWDASQVFANTGFLDGVKAKL